MYTCLLCPNHKNTFKCETAWDNGRAAIIKRHIEKNHGLDKKVLEVQQIASQLRLPLPSASSKTLSQQWTKKRNRLHPSTACDLGFIASNLCFLERNLANGKHPSRKRRASAMQSAGDNRPPLQRSSVAREGRKRRLC